MIYNEWFKLIKDIPDEIENYSKWLLGVTKIKNVLKDENGTEILIYPHISCAGGYTSFRINSRVRITFEDHYQDRTFEFGFNFLQRIIHRFDYNRTSIWGSVDHIFAEKCVSEKGGKHEYWKENPAAVSCEICLFILDDLMYNKDIGIEKSRLKKIKEELLIIQKQNSFINTIIRTLIEDKPKKVEETIIVKERKLYEYKTYIMKDEETGYVKIGRSIDPKNREKTLMAIKPSINLLYTTNKNIERKLHTEYKENRIRGEWFKLEDLHIADMIEKYKFKKVI
jgi:hypothetical protein